MSSVTSLPVARTTVQADAAFSTGRGTAGPQARYVGEHLAVYAGYATEAARRVRVSSGGVVTTLMALALREGWVDGVALSRSDFSGGRLGYRFDVVTDPAAVQAYGTSAYFNIPVDRHWQQIDAFDGRVAVVALPCHTGILHGRRERGRGLANVELLVSLFCGHNNEAELLRFVLGQHGIAEAEVADLWVDRSYLRGDLRVTLRDGRERRISFRHFNVYRSLWLFSKPLCRYCDDHLGARADLSIGDVFVPEFRRREIKHSAIVARSERGRELVEAARGAGALTLERIDPAVVYRAQKRIIVPSGDLKSRYYACRLVGYPAKRPATGRFRWRTLLTYTLLMLNDRLSQTGWGRKVIGWVPRPVLYGYIAAIKLIHNSLGADR